ncbi:hypothetical protein RRG08_030348 [Elysia crispata]|uniref:Uncharacterized protein n=1 Tax=Elysia crispata TaxID=231223 RepID=A0AAE0YI74_9GAST|nr:hypothetical protein RRG08_030348 [Elysia crispata]
MISIINTRIMQLMNSKQRKKTLTLYQGNKSISCYLKIVNFKERTGKKVHRYNDIDQPKRAPKRIRNPAEWKRHAQQWLKYIGMTYVSTTGKEKSAKAAGP